MIIIRLTGSHSRQYLATGASFLLAISFSSSSEAYAYRALKVYGYLFCVCDVDGRCSHNTFDYIIANMYWQECRSIVRNKYIVNGRLSYMGIPTKLLQLSYKDVHVLLLKAR